jgi:hypothetical protein
MVVGFYPSRRFELGVGGAIAWLAFSVLVVPTTVLILLLVLSGRAGPRSRRARPRSGGGPPSPR